MPESLPRRTLLALTFGATVAGCALPVRSPPLTLAQSRQVLVLGLPNARFMLSDVAQPAAGVRGRRAP